MRTLLLSLQPDVFNRVESGEKIFEHRRVFPNDSVIAYIYVSRPVQALTGIMYLENKVNLLEWRERYSYDKRAVERIDNYMVHHKVAMEIRKYQKTTKISLEDIRKEFPNFLIPQMYYYLDDLPLLEYLQENMKPIGNPIEHKFDDITSEMICVH